MKKVEETWCFCDLLWPYRDIPFMTILLPVCYLAWFLIATWIDSVPKKSPELKSIGFGRLRTVLWPTGGWSFLKRCFPCEKIMLSGLKYYGSSLHQWSVAHPVSNLIQRHKMKTENSMVYGFSIQPILYWARLGYKIYKRLIINIIINWRRK